MATHSHAQQHSTDLNPQEHEHPGERTYINVAIILAIITIVEVAIYYFESLRGILVPSLIIMSVAKFVIVVAYFMHLKFDDRRLAYIFASAMVVTVAVVLALEVMQRTHYIDYAVDFLTGGTHDASEPTEIE